jgi:RNA polymerase sigma factor (sigma-70 family)
VVVRPPATGHRGDLEETKLVQRAQRGDTHAYERLVQRHQATALRTAHLITGSASEAEEAAQDAFVKAYRALGGFRLGEPLRPWLLRIVVNESRNRRRAAGRRQALSFRAASVEPRIDAEGPESAVLDAERRDQLIAALGRLRDDDRLVLSCRFLLDLSEDETAQVLELRRGTVKSRTSRALARMRAELEAADA